MGEGTVSLDSNADNYDNCCVDRGVNKGDTFRLLEPDGTLVMDREGNEQWVALSDSMPTEPEGNFMVHVEESTLTDPNIDSEDEK